MDTGKAIEFVDSIINGIEKIAFWSTDDQIKPLKEGAKQVITLLKEGEKNKQKAERGEKYEAIVYDLENSKGINGLKYLIRTLKRKYFPKE